MTKQANVFPLRLPNSLKAAVVKICKEDGTSINQFVTSAVAEKISATRTADFFDTQSTDADIAEARRLLRRDGGQSPQPYDRLEDDFQASPDLGVTPTSSQ